MVILVGNPSMRLRIGAAGAERARKFFDVPTMVCAYTRIYESLLNQHKG